MRSTILTAGLVGCAALLAILPTLSLPTDARSTTAAASRPVAHDAPEPALPPAPQWLRDAGRALEAGRPDEALALVDAGVVEDAGERGRADVIGGRAALALGRPDASSRLARAVTWADHSRSPLAAHAALHLADALTAEGRHVEALDALRTAAEGGGTSSRAARVRLAVLLDAADRPAEAMALLQPMLAHELRVHPADTCAASDALAPSALGLLHASAERAGSYGTSLEALERLLLAHPCSPEARAALARPEVAVELALLARDRPDDVLARCERLVTGDGANDAVPELQALLAGDLAPAMRDRALVLLGRAHRSRGNAAAALEVFARVGDSDAVLAQRAAYNASLAARTLRRKADEARWRLRASSGIASEWRDKAALELAAEHAEAGRTNEAMALWDRVARGGFDERSRAVAGWRRAWSLHLAGQRKDALEAFDVLAASAPRAREAAAARYWAARLVPGAESRERLAHLVAAFPNDYYGVLAGDAIGAPPPPPCRDCASQDVDGALALRLAPLGPSSARIAELLAIGLDSAALEELRTLQADADAEARRALEALVLARAGRRADALRAFREAYPDWRLRRDVPAAEWCAIYPREFAGLVEEGARLHGLDEALVLGLIHQESVFEADAVSWVGARGLMQVMPATGRTIAGWLREKVTTAQLIEPGLNVRYGTTYLARLVGDLPHVEMALAGYNAGGTRARRWWAELPEKDVALFVESIPFDETRDYVKAVTFNRRLYRAAWLGDVATPDAPGAKSAALDTRAAVERAASGTAERPGDAAR